MWYIYNIYSMYIFMRGIFGIYTTFIFFKWLLGGVYKFYSYLFETQSIKMIKDNSYISI